MSREESPIVRPVSPDEGYNWMHRAFLQAFMTHNVMTADEMKPILAHVITAHSMSLSPHAPPSPPDTSTLPDPDRPWTAGDITQPQITNTLQLINAQIEPYDFEIRSIRNQQTKLTTYAFVNKTSDSLTQLATKFSPSEIAYIRRVLDHMFEVNNTHTREVMAVKHTVASQLARPSRRSRQSQINGDADGETSQATVDAGISIQEADAVLDTLVAQSFFQKSRAGYYALAPRGLMELTPYLKETYNDDDDDPDDVIIRIRDCEGCREIVTYGVRCNNRDCGVRWHDACANSYYRGRARDQRGCPKCGTVCEGMCMWGEGG
ncbi:hypothetical protein N0V83_001744 [Neocucurbitaria cava]|uniref:Non-structural maintenance of chromosomes element 1 homolog n=1 Tax=Neocucurbitaria cava TaxID=798079 RepID=A0A9W8YGB6_9PLEO|nr:hypothetical protein N0V83_001744 [Neocucurbitaria cava]